MSEDRGGYGGRCGDSRGAGGCGDSRGAGNCGNGRCDRVAPQLPDWLSGRLDPANARAVAQHVTGCDRCRAAAAGWRRVEAALADYFAAAGATGAGEAAAPAGAGATGAGEVPAPTGAGVGAAAPAGLAARINRAIAATPHPAAAWSRQRRRQALWATACAGALTAAMMALAVAFAGPAAGPDAAGRAAQLWADLALQGSLLATELTAAAPVWLLASLWAAAGLALAAVLTRDEGSRRVEAQARRG